jgi:hypothetical protein
MGDCNVRRFTSAGVGPPEADGISSRQLYTGRPGSRALNCEADRKHLPHDYVTVAPYGVVLVNTLAAPRILHRCLAALSAKT